MGGCSGRVYNTSNSRIQFRSVATSAALLGSVVFSRCLKCVSEKVGFIHEGIL